MTSNCISTEDLKNQKESLRRTSLAVSSITGTKSSGISLLRYFYLNKQYLIRHDQTEKKKQLKTGCTTLTLESILSGVRGWLGIYMMACV
jgi:hypothetical protein